MGMGGNRRSKSTRHHFHCVWLNQEGMYGRPASEKNSVPSAADGDGDGPTDGGADGGWDGDT